MKTGVSGVAGVEEFLCIKDMLLGFMQDSLGIGSPSTTSSISSLSIPKVYTFCS